MNHITFNVWPENKDNHFDIMNMEIDGHFRPTGRNDWRWREDIFTPTPISTEARILEMVEGRNENSHRLPPGKGKGKGSTVAEYESVLGGRATEPRVINTGGSTMDGGGGLLQTVHMAYNFDKDLILTPDDVFLTILAGVGAHIAKDPEKYRHVFVSFEGKMDVEVECNAPPQLWESCGVFEQFSEEIRNLVGDKWHDATLCNFSTSTPLELLISQLGFMEATGSYFEFIVSGMCGIKTMTLRGTVEDWCKVREKVEVFSTLGDLEWWMQELRLVLDQFVLARKGFVARSFWRRMIFGEHQDTGIYEKSAERCYVTGWLLALFPYTKSGCKVCPQTSLTKMWEKMFAASRSRMFTESGTCAECGKQGSGETGRGKFYCSDCWHAHDLVRRWDNIKIDQFDLHDCLSTARVTWKIGGEVVGEVKVYGGVVGSSVPSDKYEALQTVRGYAMELDEEKEEGGEEEEAAGKKGKGKDGKNKKGKKVGGAKQSGLYVRLGSWLCKKRSRAPARI